MDWRIFYADGSTYDSSQGSWDDAPLDGVVCVNVGDADYGKFTLNGLSYYYRQHEGADTDIAHTNDINPQLRLRCPWLKYGVGVPRKLWQATLVAATKDPDFPRSQAPRRRSTDRDG